MIGSNMFRSVKEILSLSTPFDVYVKGWVRFCRKQGKYIFITLSDGSCQQTLQIVSERKDMSSLPVVGQAVQVHGTLVDSPAKGQRLEVKAISCQLFDQKPDYPLAKIRPTLEHLRTIQHLRGRTATFQAVQRIRHASMMAIHHFFDKKGFQCIHTPIITSSDCEGAGEAFHVMSTEELKYRTEICDFAIQYMKKSGASARDIQQEESKLVDMKTGRKDKFFGTDAYLTVSGQLHGEAYALSLGKIYTFGPTFRAEHSKTSRHLAEFWMMEPEFVCSTLDELLELVEDQIHFCVEYVLDRCMDDIKFLHSTHNYRLITQVETMRKKFKRISYTDAIAYLQQAKDEEFESPSWGDDLSSDMEKYLVKKFDSVVIVTHYPKSLKSFYMLDTKGCDDKPTVDCMDILVPWVGELVGGSMREDDYDTLIQKMKDKDMKLELYQWYSDLRKWGSIPHGGYGMGFERFLMAMTGLHAKDLIPFYRSYTQMSM